jgi:predicted dinucleotide-binding enzyme
VPSEVLFDVFDAKRRTRRRPSLLYCGDDHDAKNVAARLIRDVGFEPEDVGPLRTARYLEPFSLAMAQLAYEGDDGPEIAYRFERFGK